MEEKWSTITALLKDADKEHHVTGMDREDFWLRLTYQQRIAVYVSNLNYQVENGGFMQWFDNGYSVCADDLIRILHEVGHCERIIEIIKRAIQILERGYEYLEEHDEELDECDRDFYENNTEMLDEVERYLVANEHGIDMDMEDVFLFYQWLDSDTCPCPVEILYHTFENIKAGYSFQDAVVHASDEWDVIPPFFTEEIEDEKPMD